MNKNNKRFYLSQGNKVYIMLGICKMLTLGGLQVWTVIDWIRLLRNTFLDGNGHALKVGRI